ncbi:hypothetical protein HYFRA_00011200 [Hymenoscyphus fraxineus]|uniref:Uncharacterized protein n=1 Tax=Hymenoscyphus fraxineus TaxID=746836 RepID=A0A9N9PRE0_9HELO|nr:hypothetical protein HYFRA_00011200 [Hymenoscyphus fraxineus]
MLAPHFEHSLPPNMADDNMEISSDHGQNIDDIDIDIEFTAVDGDAGEDYMVDDTPMNIGFEDSNNDEDLLTAPDELMGDDISFGDETDDHHDGPLDLMIDDAPASIFETVIEDLAEETAQDPSNTATGLPLDIHTENHNITSLDFGPSQSEQEAGSDTHGFPLPLESTSEPVQANSATSPVNAISDTLELGNNSESDIAAEQAILPELSTDLKESQDLNTETPNPNVSPHDATTISHREETPELPIEDEVGHGNELAENETTKSPKASALNTTDTTQTQLSQDQGNDHEELFPESTLVLAPEVVVVWRSVEYSLFPKSESDNPDTFFLSDPSILEQTLGEFLQAIRDVIHGELEDEDELCMAIEDLGLEIEETSTHLPNYTFGRIIDVFTKLLENDMDEARPLYVTLRARANFSKRYEVCKSSAIDGKGLSKVIIFRDESASQEDLAASAEHAAFDGELDAGGEVGEEEANLKTSDILDDGSYNNQTEDNQPHQSLQADQETKAWNDVEDHLQETGEADDITTSNHHTGVQEPVSNTSTPKLSDAVHTEDETARSAGDEDDLIDYSDEETEEPNKNDGTSAPILENHNHDAENQAQNGTYSDLSSPCLKPDYCFCSKCMILLAQEYEAVNQELERRRSSSRTAEVTSASQPENDEAQNIPKDEIHAEAEDLDEIDYETIPNGQDILSADDVGLEPEKEKYEDEPVDEQYLVDVKPADSAHQVDNQEATYQEQQEHLYNFDDQFDPDAATSHNVDAVEFDGVDFDDEEYTGPHESKETIDVTTVLLDFDDAVESSATVSADEPHQEDDFADFDLDDDTADATEPLHGLDAAVPLADEDEIDYEDDEDNENVDVTKAQAAIPTTPNGSMKRSISEVEVDEITASGANENKRSKS